MALMRSLGSRKGLLLTLIALVLFMVMIAEVITYLQISYSYNSFVGGTAQVQGASYFMNNARASIAIFLRGSLSSALNALAIYEATPSYRETNMVNNTAAQLENLMLTGKVYNGIAYNGSVSQDMGNSTFIDFNSSLQMLAKQMGLEVSVQNSSISVFQSAPFTVSATYTGIVHLNSSSGDFVYPLSINASVPLNGTLDLEAARIGMLRPFEGIPDFTSAVLIGSVKAKSGSISPFMFDSGTTIVLQGTPTCSNVPVQFQNGNYILATANAVDIPQSVCNMGGLVTYASNSFTPLKPYLIYSSTSNEISYLQNGTSVLLSGSTLSLLNVSPLASVVYGGEYVPQSGGYDYLDAAGGNTQQKSIYGSFSFLPDIVKKGTFNGKSSYLDAGRGSSLDITNTITLELWVDAGSLTQNSVIINQDVPTAASGDISLSFYSGMLLLGSCGSHGVSGSGLANIGNYITPGKWQQWILTYNINTGAETFYLNGMMQHLTNNGWCSNPESGNFVIGAQQAGFDFFNGSIADVQVYNSLLSPTQAETLYQEGITGTPLNNRTLAGWWPLNGNASDLSGKNNNAIVAANIIYSPIGSGYPYNPAYMWSQYAYPVSMVEGLGCNSYSICNSSIAYIGKTNQWSAYYVPIKLMNGQSVATPKPFQQMISFPAAEYSTYEAPDLGNIRFYLNGTELYSWCESGCTDLSTNTIFWIKLPGGIAANSNAILNMTFGPTTTAYDGIYAGEAPQLSYTYGQYDNGANVFNNYWNFTGTSLPSGWNTLISSATISVNNGLIFDITGSGGGGDAYYLSTISSPVIVDTYVRSSAGTSTALFFSETDIASTNWNNGNINNGYVGGFAESPITQLIWKYVGGSYTGLTSGSAPFSFPATLTFAWGGTGILASYYNYNDKITSADTSFAAGPYLIGVTAGPHITSGEVVYDWVRTRAYPPNGVMPSIAFGNVTPAYGAPQTYGSEYNGFSSSIWVPYPSSETYSYGLNGNGLTFPIALRFNGQNGYVVVPSPSISYGSATISAWINDNKPTAARMDIVNYQGIFFNVQSDKICFYVDGVNSAYLCSASSLPKGYDNVAATWNGSTDTETVYINGIASGTQSDSGTVTYPSLNAIGECSYCSGGYWFNGSIADVQVYGSALTPNQIDSLYLNNSVSNGITPAAYWPLDSPLGGLYNETPEEAAGNYGTLYGNFTNAAMPCSSTAVLSGDCGVRYSP